MSPAKTAAVALLVSIAVTFGAEFAQNKGLNWKKFAAA